MSLKISRRHMLRTSTLALAGLCAASRRVLAGGMNMEMDMQPSGNSPALAPFVDALRIPPVLNPVMRGKTAHYTMTMRAGLSKVHRDLPATVVWGFDGIYPGPTIWATRGHPVAIRHVSRLPDMHQDGMAAMAMMYPSVHLHGAHVAPQHDGHPREAISPDAFRDFHYPNQQRAATLLYHDHSHGQTGLHVYYGMAGCYLIKDPNEEALNLPTGEFDIPLMIQDRVFKADGSFHYMLDASTRETGVLGDTILVNGVVQPYLKVARRKYRLRIINASNARAYQLQLSTAEPLIHIATDGGLLPKPAPQAVIDLAPFERVDVVVDFGAYTLGTQVVLKNGGSGAGSLGSIMRFDVDIPAVDDSTVPDCLSAWEDLPVDAQTPTREFVLNRKSSPAGTVWTINDELYEMSNPPLAQVKHGALERWRFLNPTNHPHPVHIHLIQFQVLNINGVPQDPARHGWKDVLVAPPGGEITVAARFKGYTGRYLFHCHNLEHEDLGMMADYEIVP
ncbi:MAG TPA: multicopper oxidase family protein [Verrucomicrobiae bacterium]|nr:multicopper oxidase family protein [Verrucomicrobiae bacterium]